MKKKGPGYDEHIMKEPISEQKPVLNIKDGKVKKYKDIQHAVYFTGLSYDYISNRCYGKVKSDKSDEWVFK